MTDLSHSREKDKINPVVFYTSAGLILLFSLTTILFRDFSALWIGRTLDWVSKTFGWYYLLAATLYIVFVVCIASGDGLDAVSLRLNRLVDVCADGHGARIL